MPLMIRGPGITADTWSHERVVGYDLFPTFCEWGRVTQTLPREIEGGSITSLLRGEPGPVDRPREGLVFHFPHYQGDTPQTALILGDYKLLRCYEDDSRQLYDLSHDISESRDLAGAMPEKVREMNALLDLYLTGIHAQFPTPNPDYDPANPPSLQDARGRDEGKGAPKGKGRPPGSPREKTALRD